MGEEGGIGCRMKGRAGPKKKERDQDFNELTGLGPAAGNFFELQREA